MHDVTAAWLAPLVERQSAVEGSSPRPEQIISYFNLLQ